MGKKQLLKSIKRAERKREQPRDTEMDEEDPASGAAAAPPGPPGDGAWLTSPPLASAASIWGTDHVKHVVEMHADREASARRETRRVVAAGVKKKRKVKARAAARAERALAVLQKQQNKVKVVEAKLRRTAGARAASEPDATPL